MIFIEIIFAFLYLYFIIWLIYISIKQAIIDKKFNNQKIIKKQQINNYQIKKCTQQQPYKINENLSIICNFTCDGNCKIINNHNMFIS